MRHAVFIIALCAFILPLTLSAQLGPDVSVYKGEPLKWEEGSRDFFVMWKSLVQRTDGSVDTSATNPQADSCIDPNVGSTYILANGAIPVNATVERAFLVWMAVVDPTQLTAPTDNSVTLSFQHSVTSELNLSQEVTASYAGTLANVSGKDFEFEGILTTDPSGGQDGIFTYRVDVTDFFTQIQAKGNELGITDPGTTLFGSYNVKGVTCSAAEVYKTSSGLMAGWTLVVVYSSESVRAKKIYFYNGLQAYRFTSGDIQVAGFQLPNEAEIKFTLFVGEGDPGLYSAIDANIEGLQLHGPIDTSAPWLPLFDNCNPNMGNYTEVYNSISSYWAFGGTSPTCVGDVNSKVLEYAMDVDTFVIQAKDEPFATHLHKDDSFFFLKVGANQDQVYTNILVLSIDTKPPSFDIPQGTAFSQNGREKDICTCAPANEPDRVCDDRPFYYVVKVQNWGENLADNVTVQDTLPPEVDYVAGTTEIATTFDGVNGTNWTAIPDNGGFPLATAYEVYPQMEYCDPSTMTCPVSVLVRFLVQPKPGLPKNQMIKNSAYITDATGISYQSNTSVPLTVRFSNSCPPITDCPQPPKALCGGEGGGSGCTSKEQCGPNQDCIDGQCKDIVVPGDLCTGTRIDYRMGDMSPSNGNAKIIVPAPSTGLVLAQLAVNTTCAGNNKNFSLDMLRVKFEYESGTGITNLRLIKDNDNNGVDSTGDVTIATTPALATGYAEFAVNTADRTMPANVDNNLLIVADAAYANATVPSETTFKATIEGDAAFVAKDANGNITNILDEPLKFATFMFEPSVGYFIFTKGPKEPAEPSHNLINQSNPGNPVMHIRTKSLDGENQIKSIEIERIGEATVFGEGIVAISIFEDTNGDGLGDGIPVASSGEFATPVESYIFENLNINSAFQFTDKQERYYVVNVTFKLEEGMTAQVQIPNKGVKLVDSAMKVIELPIQSRVYQCVTPFCYEKKTDPCGCSVVADENEPTAPWSGIVLLMAVLGLAGFGLRSRRRDHSV